MLNGPYHDYFTTEWALKMYNLANHIYFKVVFSLFELLLTENHVTYRHDEHGLKSKRLVLIKDSMLRLYFLADLEPKLK